MTLSILIWGIAVCAAVMGLLWLRNPKLQFMSWPSFGVAGAIVGLQLNNDAITKGSLAACAIAIVGQIFYDGWRRGR